VRGVRLDYSLSGLLSGRLERVAVDGLAITLDLTGDAPLLGSLQPLLFGGESGGGQTEPIPPLSITDLRIEAKTSAGVVLAIGDGQARTVGDGETAIEMSLQEIVLGGKAIASGRFSANVSAAQAIGTADFVVTDLSVPDRLAGLSARVRLAFDASDGVVTLRLLEDATLAATRASPVFLQSLGIPSEIAGQVTQGFAARLKSPTPVAVISRDAAALDGTLQLAIPGLADLSLTLPIDLRAEGNQVRGQLRAPAELRLAQLRYGGIAELLEPTVFTVAEAEITGGFDYRMTLGGPPFRLNSQDVEAVITPGQITLTPGRIEIAEAQIEIPARRLAANGVSATVETTDAETRIGFQISSVRQTGPEAQFAPFTVTGEATRKGDEWRGTAKGAGPNGIGRFAARGSYDSTTAPPSSRSSLRLAVPNQGWWCRHLVPCRPLAARRRGKPICPGRRRALEAPAPWC